MNATRITRVACLLGVVALTIGVTSTANAQRHHRDRTIVIIDRDHGHHHGHWKKKRYYDRPYRSVSAPVVSVRLPLIVINTPNIVIGRWSDGRRYYRNPQGYYYWQGSDSRYYLDEKCVRRGDYDDRDYNEWRYRGRRDRDRDWDDD